MRIWRAFPVDLIRKLEGLCNISMTVPDVQTKEKFVIMQDDDPKGPHTAT